MNDKDISCGIYVNQLNVGNEITINSCPSDNTTSQHYYCDVTGK